MIDTPIYNHADLQNEILRLHALEQEQRLALKQRFSSVSATFSSVVSVFSGSGEESSKGGGIFNQDLVGLLSRIVLPFTLNKTLFRHSGFLMKTLVGLVSQKASHYISEDSVISIWDKAKGLFTNFLKKDKGTTYSTSFRKKAATKTSS
jgi:hypothetical protein